MVAYTAVCQCKPLMPQDDGTPSGLTIPLIAPRRSALSFARRHHDGEI